MLPGDTLIAWHYPGVQPPIQALCGVAKRPAPLCSVGLTRAVSLPERDLLNREHAFAGSRRHFSSSHCSLIEDRSEEEGASDSSGRYDSTSSPEEATQRASSLLTDCSSGTRGCQRSHNSFLPSADLEEDEGEEDEDSDGDNLHRYHEDSSFVLHGNPQWSLNNAARDTGRAWGEVGVLVGAESEDDWLSNRHGCRSGVTLMACGAENSDRLKYNTSYFTHSEHKCSPECASDSSCNSSDGVLVNFCAIYDRSNNPATPHDLSSPALLSSRSPEGSVFLNLQPVPHANSTDLRSGTTALCSPQEDQVDTTPSAPRWSPQDVDSNHNLFSFPRGLSSLEVSDLTACLQSRAILPMGTNQKYYRLVTCDLSSKSPSPAWPSLTSYPEGLSRGSTLPPSEHLFLVDRKEGQEKEAKKVSSTSTEKSLCRKAQTDSIQTLCHTSCSVCRIQDSQSTKRQGTSVVSTLPPVMLDQEHCAMQAKVKGKTEGSLENPSVRYSKAQRPTSLPIQPFVLTPADKPRAQSQHLGCLLEQYMNRKSTKPGSSQSGFKLKGKGSQCFARRQPSPMSGHRPISQEAPSSSDTCSTCTPSPECLCYRRPTTQIGSDATRTGPKPMLVQEQDKTGPYPGQTDDLTTFDPASNQSSLVKVPTCQDLIALTPEQTPANTDSKNQSPNQSQTRLLSSHTHLQHCLSPPATAPPHNKLPKYRGGAPAADSGFFLGPLTAAPLSSLSSLLSHVGSGLRRQQTRDCSGHSEKQRERSESLILAELCLAPDASYESMSISHLQRRGLLRAVSRSVDLIMAHFDNTRDPEEKMRLGNSSRSPTIAGLVLEHLCPAIQNVLEDGLRDHMLDLVVGQRRNDSWNVVEVSTRAGPSTRVLHSLVSKIRQCPQLSSHCMRLRAFIMGLLNLRSLEFWLSHLQSQKDVVTAHYHSWGFLYMSLEQCLPLFQELLLLLQPFSVLPFDLNLLLEPRMLQVGQLCAEKQGVSPPPAYSTLLMTSWPLLQGSMKAENSNHQANRNPHLQESLVSQNSSLLKQEFGQIHVELEGRSSSSARIPEWWLRETAHVDGVVKAGDCSQNYAEAWSQIHKGQEEKREKREKGTPHSLLGCRDQDDSQGGLRWAKLFGAASDVSSRTERESQSHSVAQSKRCVRPSQWLNLDRSQLGLLVQSIGYTKLGGSSDRQ